PVWGSPPAPAVTSVGDVSQVAWRQIGCGQYADSRRQPRECVQRSSGRYWPACGCWFCCCCGYTRVSDCRWSLCSLGADLGWLSLLYETGENASKQQVPPLSKTFPGRVRWTTDPSTSLGMTKCKLVWTS